MILDLVAAGLVAQPGERDEEHPKAADGAAAEFVLHHVGVDDAPALFLHFFDAALHLGFAFVKYDLGLFHQFLL